MSINLIKNTFKTSNQHSRTSTSALFKKTYHSPFPAFKLKRRSKPVAVDTVKSDAPAMDDYFSSE